MLEGVMVHVSPVGETVVASATVPVNPSIGVTVIVEDAVPPICAVMLVWEAVTEKSWTLRETVVKWLTVPLIPVIVTLYVPAGRFMHDRVDDCDEPRIMLVGFSVHVKLAGVTVEDRSTVPVKPLIGAMVMVAIPVDPANTLRLGGVGTIEKSIDCVTVTRTVIEWESDPLVAANMRE